MIQHCYLRYPAMLTMIHQALNDGKILNSGEARTDRNNRNRKTDLKGCLELESNKFATL